jgi:hypothetical protein
MATGSPRYRTKPYILSEPDLRIGDLIVELKRGAQSIRNVRAGILALAYQLAEDRSARGLLVLSGSNITRPRLEREAQLLRGVFRSDVVDRIALVTEEDGRFAGLPRDIGPEAQQRLEEELSSRAPARRTRLARYRVLEVLLHEWLLDGGPMTTESIMGILGASYPAVAAALREYEHVLARTSDRQVQLHRFPAEEWAELVAISPRLRSTTRFVDRSGAPRSPESLLRRLARSGRDDIAVGGAIAARHYLPAIDLMGTPRLDLAVHAETLDSRIIEEIDPALEPTARRDEPATVVVHLTERRESLFVRGDEGLLLVDPVDCLLDLHEARLESQARELLAHFIARRRNGAGPGLPPP